MQQPPDPYTQYPQQQCQQPSIPPQQQFQQQTQQSTTAPKKAIAWSDWFVWIFFFAACSSLLLIVLFGFTGHQAYQYDPNASGANYLGYVTYAIWARVNFTSCLFWPNVELVAIVFGHLAVAKSHKVDRKLLLFFLIITYLLGLFFLGVLCTVLSVACPASAGC